MVAGGGDEAAARESREVQATPSEGNATGEGRASNKLRNAMEAIEVGEEETAVGG